MSLNVPSTNKETKIYISITAIMYQPTEVLQSFRPTFNRHWQPPKTGLVIKKAKTWIDLIVLFPMLLHDKRGRRQAEKNHIKQDNNIKKTYLIELRKQAASLSKMHLLFSIKINNNKWIIIMHTDHNVLSFPHWDKRQKFYTCCHK